MTVSKYSASFAGTPGGPTFDMTSWRRAFALAKGLTFPETRVLLALSCYAHYRTGEEIRPSMATLAEDSNVAVNKIKGSAGVVASLAAKGWIEQVHPATGRRPAEYRLTFGATRRSHEVPVAGTPTGVVGEPGEPVAVPTWGTPTGSVEVPHTGTTRNPVVPHTGTPEVPHTGTPEVPHTGTQPLQDHYKTTEPLPPPAAADGTDTPTTDADDDADTGAALFLLDVVPTPPKAAPTFDDFWNAYPRKVAKEDARKAWAKALKAGVSPDAILAGVERQVPGWAARKAAGEGRFIPYPATWINQHRWHDEPEDVAINEGRPSWARYNDEVEQAWIRNAAGSEDPHPFHRPTLKEITQ